jgi:membrane associated rhomboid family serine protease
LLHIAGNMLYLFIFGPAVEERLGHFRFLWFYLLSGIAAGLAMIAMGPDSRVAVIGASGAIAGVLGAYFVLYPRGRIMTILPLFIFVEFIEIPAVFYLLFWFALQLWAGISAGAQGPFVGGVAWWAHVGGFLFGVAIGPLVAHHGAKSIRRKR